SRDRNAVHPCAGSIRRGIPCTARVQRYATAVIHPEDSAQSGPPKPHARDHRNPSVASMASHPSESTAHNCAVLQSGKGLPHTENGAISKSGRMARNDRDATLALATFRRNRSSNRVAINGPWTTNHG